LEGKKKKEQKKERKLGLYEFPRPLNLYNGGKTMKKTISPILGIGLLVFLAYTIVNRFITPLSDWIAIPVLLIAIALIIVGGLKNKNQ